MSVKLDSTVFPGRIELYKPEAPVVVNDIFPVGKGFSYSKTQKLNIAVLSNCGGFCCSQVMHSVISLSSTLLINELKF